jgi:hypothetical protein
MSPASTNPSMRTVAGSAPLRTSVLMGANCTRQYANLLVVGDSPEGPLKQLGKSRLKPAKNQS